MATVFTFDPAFFPLRAMDGSEWLRGELYQAPNVVVRVEYKNNPIWFLNNPLDNIKYGAAQIVPLTQRYEPPWILLGHSMGGQLLNWWLRNIGPTTPIDPALCEFIVTGDPEQAYNGLYSIPGSGGVVAYGGKGIPSNSPYKYTSAQRQYDYYGDHPNVLSNVTAMKNIKAGKAVHLDYSKESLTNPNNRTYSPPGRPHHKFVLFPTALMPAYDNKFANPQRARDLDTANRPACESAYSRPMTAVPPTSYVPKVAESSTRYRGRRMPTASPERE